MSSCTFHKNKVHMSPTQDRHLLARVDKVESLSNKPVECLLVLAHGQYVASPHGGDSYHLARLLRMDGPNSNITSVQDFWPVVPSKRHITVEPDWQWSRIHSCQYETSFETLSHATCAAPCPLSNEGSY